MRRFALLFVTLVSPLFVACGARTTALSEADFTGTPGSDGGADGSLDSTLPDAGLDSRPLFDSRPPIDTGAPLIDSTPPPLDGAFDGGGPTDHTVGDRCKSDDDCDKTGDGVSRCSAGIFSEGSLYPTNVCLGLECDPGDGTSVSHCDGDKGICLASDGAGGGICLGICSFDTSSAAPKGCVGKDVCNEASFDHDATGALVGFGYCFGGCTADSDCETSGERCQKERGLCVRRLATFTKKLGEACTSADVSKTPVACNCIYVAPTNKGYCSAFCEMGVSTCADGYTCDAFLPLLDPFTGGPGFSGKVSSLAGYCLKDCATDAECAPLNSYCAQNGGTGGKTCQPGARP